MCLFLEGVGHFRIVFEHLILQCDMPSDNIRKWKRVFDRGNQVLSTTNPQFSSNENFHKLKSNFTVKTISVSSENFHLYASTEFLLIYGPLTKASFR